MLVSESERLRDEIIAMADKFGRERSSLMPMLQEVQAKYACVSSDAMQMIADQLGIHPVEVYSVVTFYAFLNEHPKGKYVIRLSSCVSCEMAGAKKIASQLEAELDIRFGETTEDGRFTLEWTPCMGMCDQGPAMLVNHEVYTRVTPQMVHEIIEECRSKFGVYAVQEEH